MEGPNFICIGLPKAGTGWLYDQLEAHPDFWMPPAKELNYLCQKLPKMPYVDDVDDAGNRIRRRGERFLQRTPRDDRDLGFIQTAREARGKPMDLSAYAALFCFRGDLLSGDVSPPYSVLHNKTIEAVAERFPETKIMLLVRDPVARAWSQVSMSYRRDRFDVAVLEDQGGFRAFLEDSKFAGDMRATRIVKQWRACAPNLNFRTFLFDDLANDPVKMRADILSYLGADPAKPSGDLAPDYNRKAQTKQLAMTPDARRVLVEHFRDEIMESAAMFGGRSRDWVSRYGLG